MEKKNNTETFKIDKKYQKDVLEFVKLNRLENVDIFVNKCFKKGFDIEKYGILSNETEIKEIEKIVEVPVERIVEIVKEVPTPPKEIEIIKYVDREIIKEVPVEKIVEKIVNIYDKSPSELEKKISELEHNMIEQKQKYSKLIVEKEILLNNIEEIQIKKSDDKVKMLENTLLNLRKELQLKITKIIELEDKTKNLEEQISKNVEAVYLKNSNLNYKL